VGKILPLEFFTSLGEARGAPPLALAALLSLIKTGEMVEVVEGRGEGKGRAEW
jgi:hypothetical protein